METTARGRTATATYAWVEKDDADRWAAFLREMDGVEAWVESAAGTQGAAGAEKPAKGDELVFEHGYMWLWGGRCACGCGVCRGESTR